jgi:uncharacterized protein
LQVVEPRVAVITGGATGIGASLARRLAGEGWACVLLGRREDPLRRLAAEIRGEYEVCDVADREAVERVAGSVRARHPAVALLVNNAGIPGRSNFLDVDPEKAEQLVGVNYLGSLWCARAFLPALESARSARVVNVVSVAGTVAVGPYSASKHAQLAFSRSLAAELRPRGIGVLTVNPGFVHTEGFPQIVFFAAASDRSSSGPITWRIESCGRSAAARRRSSSRPGTGRPPGSRRPPRELWRGCGLAVTRASAPAGTSRR